MAQAKTRKPKKTKKARGIKATIVLADDLSSEDKDIEEEGGMYLEKEDVQLIYNALSKYMPTEKEEHLHSVLLEEFEEILVVDYDEIPADVN